MLALWGRSRYTRQRTAGRYLTVLVPFTLGLMAKPQITFPFILLLWDGTGSTKTSFGELIMEKVLRRPLSRKGESRKSLDAALQINSSDSEAEVGIGLLAERDNNYAEALHWYADAMLKKPSPITSLLLANVYRENGQPRRSVEAFHQAQSTSTDFKAAVNVADQMLISIEQEHRLDALLGFFVRLIFRGAYDLGCGAGSLLNVLESDDLSPSQQ